MTTERVLEYNINSYKVIQSGIKRQLHDLGRGFYIVRGREFRRSNAILEGKIEETLGTGADKTN